MNPEVQIGGKNDVVSRNVSNMSDEHQLDQYSEQQVTRNSVQNVVEQPDSCKDSIGTTRSHSAAALGMNDGQALARKLGDPDPSLGGSTVGRCDEAGAFTISSCDANKGGTRVT